MGAAQNAVSLTVVNNGQPANPGNLAFRLEVQVGNEKHYLGSFGDGWGRFRPYAPTGSQDWLAFDPDGSTAIQYGRPVYLKTNTSPPVYLAPAADFNAEQEPLLSFGYSGPADNPPTFLWQFIPA